MAVLSIGNIEIEVIRKDIKNLHLAVYPPNGRVRIAAPLRIDDDAVRLFAVSRMTWIKNQQKRFQKQERQSQREYVSGESHYVRGIRYLLNVIYIKPPHPQSVTIRNKKYIDLYAREGATREHRERIINEWLRKGLKEQIARLIEKWQPIIGVQVEEWGIKLMKTKWGACNRDAKRLWLNLELAKKPDSCVEYIVVHEMVHLLERNHNEIFTAYMDKFLPMWRSRKEELNRIILGYAEWKMNE